METAIADLGSLTPIPLAGTIPWGRCVTLLLDLPNPIGICGK